MHAPNCGPCRSWPFLHYSGPSLVTCNPLLQALLPPPPTPAPLRTCSSAWSAFLLPRYSTTSPLPSSYRDCTPTCTPHQGVESSTSSYNMTRTILCHHPSPSVSCREHANHAVWGTHTVPRLALNPTVIYCVCCGVRGCPALHYALIPDALHVYTLHMPIFAPTAHTSTPYAPGCTGPRTARPCPCTAAPRTSAASPR